MYSIRKKNIRLLLFNNLLKISNRAVIFGANLFVIN